MYVNKEFVQGPVLVLVVRLSRMLENLCKEKTRFQYNDVTIAVGGLKESLQLHSMRTADKYLLTAICKKL